MLSFTFLHVWSCLQSTHPWYSSLLLVSMFWRDVRCMAVISNKVFTVQHLRTLYITLLHSTLLPAWCWEMFPLAGPSHNWVPGCSQPTSINKQFWHSCHHHHVVKADNSKPSQQVINLRKQSRGKNLKPRELQWAGCFYKGGSATLLSWAIPSG